MIVIINIITSTIDDAPPAKAATGKDSRNETISIGNWSSWNGYYLLYWSEQNIFFPLKSYHFSFIFLLLNPLGKPTLGKVQLATILEEHAYSSENNVTSLMKSRIWQYWNLDPFNIGYGIHGCLI